jgi:hypothetical protein
MPLMVGSDHDMDYATGFFGNAGERAAFANGLEFARAPMQAEIDRLRAALIATQDILNGSRRYKARDALRLVQAALTLDGSPPRRT